MDWDNLRFFLELARSGTLQSAARRLAVDHTTVARRIQALEKQVGSPLFSREAGGHRLTEAGRRLQPQVEAMENAFRSVESAAPASHEGLSGVVRIGATEGFGTVVLAPQLALFAGRHPGCTSPERHPSVTARVAGLGTARRRIPSLPIRVDRGHRAGRTRQRR